jgi:hypothetical protein
MDAPALEQKWLEMDVRFARSDILYLDSRCFNLELRHRKLMFRWPGHTPEQQRVLRREREKIRHEVAMLRVDLEILQRKVDKLLGS